jgi:uncharacterized protein YodC (DUF2158 family)
MIIGSLFLVALPPIMANSTLRAAKRGFMQLPLEVEMEIGDLVRLKSGGPTITVEVITKETADPVVRRVWFDNEEFFPQRLWKRSMVKWESVRSDLSVRTQKAGVALMSGKLRLCDVASWHQPGRRPFRRRGLKATVHLNHQP